MCVWIEDADAIEMTDRSLKIVYQNARVNRFINSKKMLGISGIKGQGKTFLLKVKRNLAMQDEILCFPQNSMVDLLDSSLEINHSIFKYMEDYTKWVSLWKIAISMIIIKYNETNLDMEEFQKTAPKGILCLLNKKNQNFRPSVYINELLQMDREMLNQTISYTSSLLSILQNIHSAIYVFIDKIDQAFSVDIHRIYGDSNMSRGPRNASFWQYCQYALANASYDLYNVNNHIKVYYSIRQEALIDTNKLAPNLKRNIEAYIVNLEYNKSDLKCMFDMYVNNEDNDNLYSSKYKRSNPMMAFLGIDTLLNKHIAQTENAFDYIYRHSLKRPSDIMKICKHLSFDNKELDISRIRNTVNSCAGEILTMYIDELSPFLPYGIDDFFMHINTNVLNISYIKYICRRYLDNKIDVYTCSKDCENCANMHPFTILYNIGLLGFVKEDITNHKHIQYFNRAGSSTFLEKLAQFPISDYYFIHPCLMDAIYEKRCECGLQHFTDDNYIIGDSYEFSDEKTNSINKNIIMAKKELKKEDVFISSTIDDLVQERSTVKKALIERGYNPIMSEENNFPLNANELRKVHSHDYCIDKLLECGSLIFIIGKEYGGIYAGKKYERYQQEIIEYSKGKIKKPSISLMEFYIAVKKNLIHYAFINKQFDDKDNRKQDWSKDIIKEYNFINHLEQDGKINNNWISRYENTDDLSIRIKHLVFMS